MHTGPDSSASGAPSQGRGVLTWDRSLGCEGRGTLIATPRDKSPQRQVQSSPEPSCSLPFLGLAIQSCGFCKTPQNLSPNVHFFALVPAQVEGCYLQRKALSKMCSFWRQIASQDLQMKVWQPQCRFLGSQNWWITLVPQCGYNERNLQREMQLNLAKCLSLHILEIII